MPVAHGQHHLTLGRRATTGRRSVSRGVALSVLTSFLTLSGLVTFGAPASADVVGAPLTPVAVSATQSGVASDLLASWTPSDSGTPATGAIVQLYEISDEVATYRTEITCGASCTTTIFRGLTFGSTYEVTVWPTNASGAGIPGGSGPATLATTCPAGACVTLDATTPIGAANQSASGILDSVVSVPDMASDLSTLKTQMYRGAPGPNGDGTFNWQNWNVAVGAGTQTTLILSDEYNEASGGNPPTPWSDWTAYDTEITKLVTELVASGEQINYWEPYNEPGGDDGYYDAAGYASETPALLLAQFLHTYQDIRAVVPNAAIIGPSLEHWSDYAGQYGDHAFDMATFLSFASANNLDLAAISWHEIDDNLGPNPEENALFPTMIQDHVAEARQLIAALPALGSPQIFIDEYGMPEVQNIPGWDVAYLSALTDAGVDSANRSCWFGACGEPVLDGLVGDHGASDPPIFDERLVYASMSGNMITTASTTDSVTALGSFDSSDGGTLKALIGRSVGCTQDPVCASSWPTATDAPPTSVSVSVTVPWNGGSALIALTDIEGQTFSDAPATTPVASQADITSEGTDTGTATFDIPSFADGDAYSLVLTHSDALAPPPVSPPPVVSPPVVTSSASTAPNTPTSASCAAPAGGPSGYQLSASDGGVFNFGNIPFCGSTGSMTLNRPIVGSALTRDGGGYWEVASDGGIFAFGDAPFLGSTGSLTLDSPIVGMAATPDGKGYWLVASDGGVFAFGDAPFYGSMGYARLNRPIVGMAATPDGKGYWLVASDGGIFAFGDARFLGSMGGHTLNAPVVAMAADQATGGYWEVASDGGVFSFDAPFFGSMGGHHLVRPIVAMSSTATGDGYRFVASDGGVFTFGDAPFFGSMGGRVLNRPVVSVGST